MRFSERRSAPSLSFRVRLAMAHLISFTTTKFDVSKETPNPINPIAGQGVLNWLREKLTTTPWKATLPDAEDWGWYMYVKNEGQSYMVGASGEVGEIPTLDWIIQIHKRRSLIEKLTGRNKMTADDALSRVVEDFARKESGFTNVEVDKTA
jgi:hypothetical protein